MRNIEQWLDGEDVRHYGRRRKRRCKLYSMPANMD